MKSAVFAALLVSAMCTPPTKTHTWSPTHVKTATPVPVPAPVPVAAATVTPANVPAPVPTTSGSGNVTVVPEVAVAYKITATYTVDTTVALTTDLLGEVIAHMVKAGVPQLEALVSVGVPIHSGKTVVVTVYDTPHADTAKDSWETLFAEEHNVGGTVYASPAVSTETLKEDDDGSGSVLIIIIILVVILIIGAAAGAAYYFLVHQKKQSPAIKPSQYDGAETA